MNGAIIYRRIRSGCALAAFLAIGLLCVGPCSAQTSSTDKSGAQSQVTQKDDKSNAKDDKSATPHTTRLKINVTNSEDKPVGNASVYVRFNEAGGFLHHDKLAELSFKTNEDGSVKVPAVPAGKILIQVIAKGLHTYGKWYDIEDETATIDIKLDPPPHWY
jgi:Carboxypeptidase regulatory-like domain